MSQLHQEIRECRVCEAHLSHGARPIVQFSPTSRLVIIGQAPGSKVHASGVPWEDDSGKRLCEWTGLSNAELHDPEIIALVPMGFCYPGKGKSGDLPPRGECAPLWHERILQSLPEVRLTLLVGSYAQAAYLPETKKLSLTGRVHQFARFQPKFFLLPHPSWRSTVFMRKNPWFEAELLPILRKNISQALSR